MGSKNGLTYIIELRYYSILSSIVPQLRYNYKLGCFNYREVWSSSSSAEWQILKAVVHLSKEIYNFDNH